MGHTRLGRAASPGRHAWIPTCGDRVGFRIRPANPLHDPLPSTPPRAKDVAESANGSAGIDRDAIWVSTPLGPTWVVDTDDEGAAGPRSQRDIMFVLARRPRVLV